MTRSQAAYALMFGSAVAFASMSACTSALSQRCDWRVGAMVRASLAFAFMLVIARSANVPLVWPGPKTLWVRSLVGTIGMLCTFFSLARLPVSESVTLLNSFPLWVALLSWPVLGLRPSAGAWIAVLCGFVGVNFIAQSQGGLTLAADSRWAATCAALSASLSTAVVMLGLHRLRHLHPIAIATHFAGVSSCIVISLCLITAAFVRPFDAFASADPKTWLLMLGVGGFATMGQLLMTWAFQHGLPDRLATVGLSQCVIALGYDVLIWNRGFDAWLLAGIVCVLAPGAWLVLHRPRHAEQLAVEPAAP